MNKLSKNKFFTLVQKANEKKQTQKSIQKFKINRNSHKVRTMKEKNERKSNKK